MDASDSIPSRYSEGEVRRLLVRISELSSRNDELKKMATSSEFRANALSIEVEEMRKILSEKKKSDHLTVDTSLKNSFSNDDHTSENMKEINANVLSMISASTKCDKDSFLLSFSSLCELTVKLPGPHLQNLTFVSFSNSVKRVRESVHKTCPEELKSIKNVCRTFEKVETNNRQISVLEQDFVDEIAMPYDDFDCMTGVLVMDETLLSDHNENLNKIQLKQGPKRERKSISSKVPERRRSTRIARRQSVKGSKFDSVYNSFNNENDQCTFNHHAAAPEISVLPSTLTANFKVKDVDTKNIIGPLKTHAEINPEATEVAFSSTFPQPSVSESISKRFEPFEKTNSMKDYLPFKNSMKANQDASISAAQVKKVRLTRSKPLARLAEISTVTSTIRRTQTPQKKAIKPMSFSLNNPSVSTCKKVMNANENCSSSRPELLSKASKINLAPNSMNIPVKKDARKKRVTSKGVTISDSFEMLTVYSESITSTIITKHAQEWFSSCSAPGCVTHIVFASALILGQRHSNKFSNLSWDLVISAIQPLLKEFVTLEAVSLRFENENIAIRDTSYKTKVSFSAYDLSSVTMPDDLHPKSIQYLLSVIRQLITVQSEGKILIQKTKKSVAGIHSFVQGLLTLSAISKKVKNLNLPSDQYSILSGALIGSSKYFGSSTSIEYISGCATMLHTELKGLSCPLSTKFGPVNEPESVLHKRLIELLSSTIRFHLRRLVNSPPQSPTVATVLEKSRLELGEDHCSNKVRSNVWKIVSFAQVPNRREERTLSAIFTQALRLIHQFSLDKVQIQLERAEQFLIDQSNQVETNHNWHIVFERAVDQLEDLSEVCSLFRASKFLFDFLTWPGLQEAVIEAGGWTPIESFANQLTESIGSCSVCFGDAHFSLLKSMNSLVQQLENTNSSICASRAETAYQNTEVFFLKCAKQANQSNSWIKEFGTELRNNMIFPQLTRPE